MLPTTTTESTISECVICKSPLGQDSKDSGYFVCHEHRNCAICGKPLLPRQIRIIRDQAQFHGEELTPDIVVHDNCKLDQIAADNNGKIPVSLAEIDLLNRYRLCLFPELSLSEEANIKQAEQTLPALITQMSHEEQYLFMRRLQIISARLSIALATSKDSIKKELAEKQKKEYEEVQKIREKVKASPPPTSENTYGYSQKVWDNLSNVEKKRIRDREKGILALVKFGVSREDAEKSVDAHKK